MKGKKLIQLMSIACFELILLITMCKSSFVNLINLPNSSSGENTGMSILANIPARTDTGIIIVPVKKWAFIARARIKPILTRVLAWATPCNPFDNATCKNL